ncbi:hypothetical protein IWW34DRAFT_799041 [Fusarium oxysporum f. sp. albedinis]|nr:hypothetical protein IWW34DRAFT_799041 [Fusarium oxysporum f. sp. albedinis]
MWMDCEITGLLEGEILGDLDTCGTTFVHCINSVRLNHSKSQSDQLQIITSPSAYQICIAQYYLHMFPATSKPRCAVAARKWRFSSNPAA